MALVTVVIWGVQFPIAKSAFETVDAFHSAIVRFGIPAMILVIILVMREGRSALAFNRETREVGFLGVVGMCGAPSLIFGGLMFTRPEIAAIIVATQPIMTVIAQRFAGGTRPGIVSISCIALAFLGVVTVVTQWRTDLQLTQRELLGDFMAVIGAICWVIYTIAIGRFKHWSSLRVTTVSMVSGAAANTLLAFILVALGFLQRPSISDWYIVRYEMAFLAFIGVLIAMTCWNIGTRKLGPLNAMLFINLIPIVTFMVRYYQGYRFTWVELLGVGMVITALLTQNMVMRYRMARAQ